MQISRRERRLNRSPLRRKKILRPILINRRKRRLAVFTILKILGGALAILTLSGGLYINSQREAIIEKALTTAEETASKTLGVPVKIGGVDFNDINFFDRDKLSDITVRDIEIFDKQKELIARVDTAQINFKLLALRDDPVAALDEIKLDGATLNLKQRDDESWNVNDIKVEEGEGETTFGAKISLTRGTINADFDGKNISLEEISAAADCADMNAIPVDVSAKTLGANVKASGTVSKAQQVISFRICPPIKSPKAWKFWAARRKIFLCTCSTATTL